MTADLPVPPATAELRLGTARRLADGRLAISLTVGPYALDLTAAPHVAAGLAQRLVAALAAEPPAPRS